MRWDDGNHCPLLTVSIPMKVQTPNSHHHHLNGQRLIQVDFISDPLCNHRRLRIHCKYAAWQEPRGEERSRKISKHLFAVLSCLELCHMLQPTPFKGSYHWIMLILVDMVSTNSKTADNDTNKMWQNGDLPIMHLGLLTWAKDRPHKQQRQISDPSV